MMKVSVIVPVYNAEGYLEECILSVLDQTHDNIQVILVNDGSEDKSGEICDAYAERCPEKVIVVHQKNGGPLLARERGLLVATGDIFLFLDSDDRLAKNAAALLASEFKKSQCDLIIFNASVEMDYSKAFHHYPFASGEMFAGEGKKELYELLLQTSELNNLCLKAVKRDVVDFTFDYEKFCFVKHGEDLLRSVTLLDRASKVLFLDENLYYYRQHEGSICHTFNKERHKSIKAVHRELERYIDLWGMGAYHSKHYTREVRGWIETLVQLVNSRNTLPEDEYRVLLDELATDEYFRHAYEKMDASVLRKEQVLLADWLYKRQYMKIHLIYGLRKMLKVIRKI